MSHNAPSASDNPCMHCGACCAHFRVSFYWAEALENGLPEAWYEALTPTLACMQGTNSPSPRCAALEGEVGHAVRCRVYAQRTSACRQVLAGDEQCLKARTSHGLPPALHPLTSH